MRNISKYIRESILFVGLFFLACGLMSQVTGGRDAVLYESGLLNMNDGGLMRIELAGQTDANSSIAGVPIQLGAQSLNNITGAGVSGNSITLPEGVYKIEVIPNLEVASNGPQRPNVGLVFNLNGSQYSVQYGNNYIRRAGGHNESSGVFIEAFELTSTGTIDFEIFQQAIGGVVTLADGKVIITKHGS